VCKPETHRKRYQVKKSEVKKFGQVTVASGEKALVSAFVGNMSKPDKLHLARELAGHPSSPEKTRKVFEDVISHKDSRWCWKKVLTLMSKWVKDNPRAEAA